MVLANLLVRALLFAFLFILMTYLVFQEPFNEKLTKSVEPPKILFKIDSFFPTTKVVSSQSPLLPPLLRYNGSRSAEREVSLKGIYKGRFPVLAFGEQELDLYSLYLTQSHERAKRQRNAIRRASLSLVNTSRYNIGYYFFMTPPTDPGVLEAVLAENATHGDLAFSTQLNDLDTSHKLYDEMRHVSLRKDAPRAKYVGKFDDDSMVRYDHLLPILETVPRTGIMWARRGGWGFFPWWNFIVSADVSKAVSNKPMATHCLREDDVCIGEMAKEAVSFFIDDSRWFNLDPAAICTSPTLWCRPIESNPINDTDALVAHHATADMMNTWANENPSLLNSV